MKECDKTNEPSGTAGTALTEIIPASPENAQWHRKGNSTEQDQESGSVEKPIREFTKPIPKKVVNKEITFSKSQNSTSSSASSASTSRMEMENEKAAKKEAAAAAKARTQRKKKADANRREKNRAAAMKMEQMEKELNDLRAAAAAGKGEKSGSPGASPARQPLPPSPQRQLAPPFRRGAAGKRDTEMDAKFALPSPIDARQNRQTQAMVTPRQPKALLANANSRFKLGRPQEISSIERQDKAGEGKSKGDELAGIKDLKSLRPNPLKELASYYKKKVEGSIAELMLKHRLHKDSCKSLENQIDRMFAEKRRLEGLEKGEEEPQRKRPKDINTNTFSASPRECEPVLRTSEDSARSSQKPSPRDRVADDARERDADVGQGKSSRGFRGRARGRGRGRGQLAYQGRIEQNRFENKPSTYDNRFYRKQENRLYEGRHPNGNDTDGEEEAQEQ